MDLLKAYMDKESRSNQILLPDGPVESSSEAQIQTKVSRFDKLMDDQSEPNEMSELDRYLNLKLPKVPDNGNIKKQFRISFIAFIYLFLIFRKI